MTQFNYFPTWNCTRCCLATRVTTQSHRRWDSYCQNTQASPDSRNQTTQQKPISWQSFCALCVLGRSILVTKTQQQQTQILDACWLVSKKENSQRTTTTIAHNNRNNQRFNAHTQHPSFFFDKKRNNRFIPCLVNIIKTKHPKNEIPFFGHRSFPVRIHRNSGRRLGFGKAMFGTGIGGIR